MNKRFGKTLLGLFIGIVLLGSVSIPKPVYAVEVFKQKWVYFSATAGEALSIGDVVYLNSSDGEVYKADADDSTKRPPVGVVGTIAADGASVMVVRQGILGGQTSATSGDQLFLSTTAGAIDYDGDTPLTGNSFFNIGFVMPGSSGASTDYYIDIPPCDQP